MKILFKHTLHSIGKNPVQTIIMVISVIIVTACALLCLNISSIFRQTAELWGPSAFGSGNYCIYCNAGDYYHENGDKITPEEQYREIETFVENLGGNAFFQSQSAVFLETDGHTVQATANYVENLDDANKRTSARILEETAPSSEYPNAYISFKFAELTGLAPGDTFTIKGSDDKIFVRGISDNYGLYYGPTNVKVAIEDKDVWDRSTMICTVYLPESMSDADFSARFHAEKKAGNIKAASLLSEPMTHYQAMVDDSVRNSMKLVGIAAGAIGAVMAVLLASSFTVIVRARSEELIRFKTAGATPMESAAILFSESITYSVIGGAIGLGAGRLMIAAVEGSLKGTLMTGTIGATPISYLYAILIGIGVALLSSAIPAVILGVKPIRELTGGKIKIARRPLFVPAVSGLALTVAGAVWVSRSEYETEPAFLLIAGLAVLIPTFIPLLIWGISKICERFSGAAFLAPAAAGRNHGVRSAAVMTTALITFVSFGAAILNVVGYSSVSSYERLQSDYVINFANVEADGLDRFDRAEEVVQRAKKLDYVEDAALVKLIGASATKISNGARLGDLRLYGVESSADLKFVAPDCPEKYFEAFDSTPNAVIISSALAYGWGMEIGEEIKLLNDGIFETDADGAPFTVVGIDETVTGNDQMLIIKYSDFDNYGDITVSLNADSSRFDDLREEFETDYVTVMYREDFYSGEGMDKIQVGNLLPAFLTIIYGISAMGLINLLVISAAERKEEFATLRLAGADPGKGAAYIASESLETGAVTFVAGFLCASLISMTSKGIGSIIGKYTFPEFFTTDSLLFAGVGSAIFMVANFLVNFVSFLLSGYRTLGTRQG